MSRPVVAAGSAAHYPQHYRLEDLLGLDASLPPELIADLCAAVAAELTALVPFVPPPLVRQQLAAPNPGWVGGDYWHGSILFADLSGFTALSERLAALGREGAEEVRRIISELFSALLDELHVAGGAVLKFGGDALTAFFDRETLGSAHAALACRAALAMQQRMASFDALETRAGAARLRLRIGVHSGRIFAAQVGDADHIELVVTGRQVNRVALAQEIAEPGAVVISQETRDLLGNAHWEPRQSGFFALGNLHDLPALPLAAPALSLPAQASVADLHLLARQALALRPYLTRRLPERFISADPAQGPQGEFRPVSVLFANFYPFSSLLASLGEDTATAAAVLNSYYRRAQAVIHAYDGIVNKVDLSSYGDKLMALFGAPIAREDDAERVVRAALDLQHALGDANREIADLFACLPASQRQIMLGDVDPVGAIQPNTRSLQQRIGINTGTVFAGLVGASARHEYTVMGSAVNLAARLMGAAEEGCIVLAPSTARAVGHKFVLHDQEPVQLKGLAEPIRPAQVLGEREIQASGSRSGFAHASLVGRDGELAQALRVSARALAGEGQVLVLTGDAGIGKTRLSEELCFRLAVGVTEYDLPPQLFLPAPAECQSFQQNTPYTPIRALLRQLLGISSRTPEQAAIQLADQLQLLVPEHARFTPLLAQLLGLPAEETPLIVALTAEQRRNRLHELVVALIRALSSREALLLLVDDLQWIDEASHALLSAIAAGIGEHPVLLLLVYRPDTQLSEPWLELPHCARLTLDELPGDESVQLASGILDGPLPEGLLPLVERAQGNPFFIEELIQTLVERGMLQRTPQGWRLSAEQATVQLPDTIEGVITARLDTLPERDRDVLQVASVIGRRFPYPVLTGVYNRDELLPPALNHLTDSNLIARDVDAMIVAYLFRQALTREVAYESILFARRRELNRQVARCIEQMAGPDNPDQLAPLARYYLLAEEWTLALHYHLEAGKRAMSQFANRSAILLFEQALAVVRRLLSLPAGEPLPQLQWAQFEPSLAPRVVELIERLGHVLTTVGEYDAALERYEAALTLLQSNPSAEPREVARIYRQIGEAHERKGDFEQAQAALATGRTLLGLTPSVELARNYLLGAGIYHRQGNYIDSIEWAEHARILAEKVGSEREHAHAYLLIGASRHALGDAVRASQDTRRSLAMFQQAADLAGVAKAYNNLAGLLHDLGDWEEARRAYHEAAELERSIGDLYGQAKIANNLGEVLRGMGDVDEAIEQYQIAQRFWQSSQYGSAVIAMNLGAAYVLRGDLELAEEQLNASRLLFDQVGAEDFLPELLRYQAELALARGMPQQALIIVAESIEIARRLEAPLEEGVARRVAAQAWLRLQQPAEATYELDRALDLLREVGNRHELARALLVQVEFLARQEPAATVEVLQEAMSLLQSLGARLDLERARQLQSQLA